MTFKERLMIEHPECVGSEFEAGFKGCPFNYGYETKSESLTNCRVCSGKGCAHCWNREIPVDDLKPGDKVRLRKGLVVGKVYDGLTLYSTMLFEGERKVTSKTGQGNYCLNTWYRYSPVMLEKVKAEETENEKREENKMVERKFKVGDKVRTTKLEDHSGCKLFPVGTVGKIRAVVGDETEKLPYKVEAYDDYWWYSDDMLELVEEGDENMEEKEQKETKKQGVTNEMIQEELKVIGKAMGMILNNQLHELNKEHRATEESDEKKKVRNAVMATITSRDMVTDVCKTAERNMKMQSEEKDQTEHIAEGVKEFISMLESLLK